MSIKEHPPLGDSGSLEFSQHVPVLLDATVRLLDPKPGEKYLDLTAGYGGHAGRILQRTENYVGSVLVDRDENAIAALESFKQKGVRLVSTDFVSAARQLIHEGRQFNLLLVDLGVSSPQLDQSTRGFSFRFAGPLDMRMDTRQEETAEQLVNSMSMDDLAQIIARYGEEPFGNARKIATAIAKHRPFHTTDELATLIEQISPRGRRKIHPATRTFQALRIAVNHELEQIETLLPLIPQLLEPGGRVGVISFHSLEDRLVKRYFKAERDAGYEAELTILTKKPLSGSDNDVHNPRSRSAKLRVAVKK
ncbi:MAG TPA: 16S rRNA (cytosine(1402)-N(4))-methyltransferase RsmH [Candidatus Saccharimonadaceae bacterium]|nr:16S rRNA (cytosine(1402)-N(4))-methyltransferase RsmH [Candidatus Saccharimonadaceae bacterium]